MTILLQKTGETKNVKNTTSQQKTSMMRSQTWIQTLPQKQKNLNNHTGKPTNQENFEKDNQEPRGIKSPKLPCKIYNQ